jgi:ElaB/YqjD/DUF883 family membrane-anchored ribosome-binding protein
MAREKEMQEIRNIEAYVRDLRKDVDKRLAELKLQMNEAQTKATKKVTERPLLGLGIAFVAGMAVGIALSKAND